MATVTSVVTVDTNEWKYPGVDGITHTVTNGQTFNLTIENTASNIKWEVLPGQTMTTTDGYTLTFRPLYDSSNTSHGTFVGATADSTMSTTVPGELIMSCSDTEIEQRWKWAQFYTTNVDMNAAGTLGANTAATQCVLEDQYGHTMTLPAGLVAGITVAQAA